MSTGGFRRLAAPALAVALGLAAYGLARLPAVGADERAALAARFRFERLPLAERPGTARAARTRRPVNPRLEHLSAWISTVGAGVALTDLDGDGLPNDVITVDPRTDTVFVASAPTGPARYAPCALEPGALRWDSATMAPMGALPGDLDEDGRIDVLVYCWGRSPIAYLRRGEGFEPVEVIDPPEEWYSNAATFADLDGDGHPDLVAGNYFPEDARVLDAHATSGGAMQASMSRAFNGGRDRLLLWKPAAAGAPVRFEDQSAALGEDVLRGWTLAVGAADLDGDQLPELYLAHDFGPDRLLHNRSEPGRLRFAPLEGRRGLWTPASCVVGRDSFKGMGVDFGDLNGDGLLDIYVSNIAQEYALEESHFVWLSTGHPERMKDGVAPYEDAGEALGLSRSGWAWDCRLADFDNDGAAEALQATGFARGSVNRWPELHELAMGNDGLLPRPGAWLRMGPRDDLSGDAHVPFFVRAAGGRYVDLAREVGLGASQVSRGIAIGDPDGDGDLDFALANQWEGSWLYRNDAPRAGAFLGLHVLVALEPDAPTRVTAGAALPAGARARPAVGAEVSLQPGGRKLVAQVDGGNGHSGKRSADVHFGLGDHPPDRELAVELRWRAPGGAARRETLRLLPGWHTVVLGAPEDRR
jgi:hypothetical protein